MCTLRGFVILAASLAATMAVPAQNRALEAVTGGINQFSSSFFAEVSRGNSGNLITSPLSASIALSMAAYGSRGETEKEFQQVLHIPEESVGRAGYASLTDSLNAVKSVELHLGNKVFVNQHFTVKPTYQELTQTAFRSSSQTLNFAQSQQAANTINQWCEEQTNHRIKDIIQPDKINANTAMVLVNAVYFKGNWADKFEPKLTEDKPFHVTKSVVKNVPTMFRLGSYRYGVLPELKAKFVELPYKGEELSMIIVLPDELDGLAQLEEKLAQKDLTELIKTGHKVEVALHLPKFKIESTLDLGAHLQNMGLRQAFDQANANFEGISDTDVFISSVVQKAFIEVNEEGTEAAGVTAIHLMFKTIVITPKFIVDHPFFYSIVKVTGNDGNDSNGLLSLFTGHVVEPKS